MLRFTYASKFTVQRVLFFSNLLIFLGCALYLGSYFITGYLNERSVQELRNRMDSFRLNPSTAKPITDDSEVDLGEDQTTERKMLDEYVQARKGDYPYLVGRIKIDDTPIDYFVMQTPDDPEYFLHKDVEGKDNKEGVPFVDVNCDLKKPSNNVIIYGHAMKNQHQFGSLKKYKSKDYYKKHSIIKFETLYEPEAKYEVVAAFYSRVYDVEDENVFRYYYFYGTEDRKEFDYFIDNIRGVQCYNTKIVPKFGDQLLTLSTCNYEQADAKHGRFVVVARKVVEKKK